ncbi:hypothetical protein WJX77_012593 [Trebouxia sp. C0004]
MHLSVHKDYLNDKGLAFDEQAWAVEHFLLNDPKTVYPGKPGEELWVTWRGRYATLGRYPAAPCGVEGGHSIPEHHHWHSQADCAHGSVGAGLGRGSTEEEQPISPLA